MSDSVSLSSLYRRSRYERIEPLENGEGKQAQERKELFAVAAVAFTMKHEADFKRHFLKEVCGVNDTGNADDYKILLQPHDFDLALLKATEKSEAIVVEFKVGADLEPKQDFRKKEFELSPQGYGYQIQDDKEGKYSKYANLKYVILLPKENQGSLSENSVRVGRIQCHSRTWSRLLYAGQEPPLVEELLNWLGQNVSEMKSRIYKNMKNVQSTKAAAEMCGILSCVSEKLLNQKRPKIRWTMDESDYSFGVDIPKESDGFDGIRKQKNPRWPLGWFGYCKRQGNEPRLEVWIYIGSNVAKELAEWIKRRLGDTAEVKADPDSNIVISCSQPRDGDMEWFESVLRKLK